jgi:hypothetical protein
LSNDVQITPISQRNEKDGEYFLDRGNVMQENGSYFYGIDGAYIAHPDDVLAVLLTSDSRRLNGCCGLDGVDGANLQCESCGTYVSTKKTDCWMPHCVVFDTATTVAVF